MNSDMPRAPIAMIVGIERASDGDFPMVHRVGNGEGCTSIVRRREDQGDHDLYWFDVYQDYELVCSINHKVVAEIHYENSPSYEETDISF